MKHKRFQYKEHYLCKMVIKKIVQQLILNDAVKKRKIQLELAKPIGENWEKSNENNNGGSKANR